MGEACDTYRGQEVAYTVLVGGLKERDHLEDLGIGGRMILKWIFEKWCGGTWVGLIWLRIWTGGGLL
jgi:hypothetical protein